MSGVDNSIEAHGSLLKARKPAGFAFSIRPLEIRNIYMLSMADAHSVTGRNQIRFFETEDFILVFAIPIGNLVDTQTLPLVLIVAEELENFGDTSIRDAIDSSSMLLCNRLIIVTPTGLLVSVEFKKQS
tara:strand:- start:262 stop:648 length:387 start_codon:yes stop_codon:yes gene_type:complete